MKKLIYLTLALLCASPLCTQAQENKAQTQSKSADMLFENNIIDLGKLESKQTKADTVFRFTNSGQSPLVIYSVEVSCDCTDIEYSKKPIMPGERSEIYVEYDHKKVLGTFYKAIQVYANTDAGRHIITLKGEVVKK